MSDYRAKYYKDSRTGREPVLEYINRLRLKEQTKILRDIELLRECEGRLPEPHCKHIGGKIWELRTQFSPNNHRVLYVIVTNKLIILLHAFTKKTEKLPTRELSQAQNNYRDALLNINQYYENQ